VSDCVAYRFKLRLTIYSVIRSK